MFRAVLPALLSLPIATAAIAAEPIGVPSCDEFLTKYEACLSGKVPPAQKSLFQGQIDQLRNGWSSLAKNPQTKATLESACKTSAEQMKATVASYGCQF